MICEFCNQDFKEEFLSRVKIDEGERVIICNDCEVKLMEKSK